MSAAPVRWVGGALWAGGPRGGVLIDAPVGVDRALEEAGLLPSLQGVVISSSRTRSVAGLLALWDALGRARQRTFNVTHVLGDERTPLLAAAWAQGWPDGVGLDLDGLTPGGITEIAGVEVELVPLRMGEASWGPGAVHPVTGCGLRLRVRGQTIAWAPTCRPGTAVARLCLGADLAVVEVGTGPWPASEAPWRLSVDDATRAGVGAREVWLVSDEGERVGGDGAEA